MTEVQEFEWVDEIPKRSGGGKKGSGKYQKLVDVLAGSPGKVAKLGPYSTGAGSGAVARLKELGADATSRTIDGEVFVYVTAKNAPADEGETGESIFDEEV